MVYPGGGNVWCSPTSVSMLLAYWQNYKGLPEPLVRETVAGVYDAIYEGAGNWSFNTAYAATRGMNSAVSRLASLEEAEEFIARGIPLAMSLSWKPGELTGAPVEKSNGHLVVLAGFDALGNPVVNDPAAKEDSLVRRVYQRQEFEKLWRITSGGVVYIITPPELPGLNNGCSQEQNQTGGRFSLLWFSSGNLNRTRTLPDPLHCRIVDGALPTLAISSHEPLTFTRTTSAVKSVTVGRRCSRGRIPPRKYPRVLAASQSG